MNLFVIRNQNGAYFCGFVRDYDAKGHQYKPEFKQMPGMLVVLPQSDMQETLTDIRKYTNIKEPDYILEALVFNP